MEHFTTSQTSKCEAHAAGVQLRSEDHHNEQVSSSNPK